MMEHKNSIEFKVNWFKSQGQNVDSPCQMSITVR